MIVILSFTINILPSISCEYLLSCYTYTYDAETKQACVGSWKFGTHAGVSLVSGILLPTL